MINNKYIEVSAALYVLFKKDNDRVKQNEKKRKEKKRKKVSTLKAPLCGPRRQRLLTLGFCTISVKRNT
jgi:hypothetical protein